MVSWHHLLSLPLRFDDDLEDCQESAQEARLGLWADDDPVAPWVWRRK